MTSAVGTKKFPARPEDRLDRVFPQLASFGAFTANNSPLSRLADPLFGAVEPSKDRAVAEPRLEPRLTPIGFAEPKRLDSVRAAPEANAPGPTSRMRRSPAAVIGSAAVHLLPLLLLLDWTGAPARMPRPIPVTLVIERPPPPLPPKPPVEKRRPPGNLASVDTGERTAEKPEAASPPTPSSSETKLADIEPPRPAAPPRFESALPTPLPAPDIADLPQVEKPGPQYKEPPKRILAAREPNRRPSPRFGEVLGPAATRDQYLVYCAALIRRYEGMLAPALLAGRRGFAVLSLQVLDDGTIARVEIKRSSGYPEIDERAERMVAAVHRFPAVPQWYQGSKITLDYQFAFRDGAVVH